MSNKHRSAEQQAWREYMSEKVTTGLLQCDIPNHMHEAILMYVLDGIEPGSFFYSVLANDFTGAVGRADHINIHHLKNYADLLYNFLPSDVWGSSVKVQDWISKKQLERVSGMIDND